MQTGPTDESLFGAFVGRDGQPIRHGCVDAQTINCGQSANDTREAIRQSLSHLIVSAARSS
ncbi:hypothetical protein GCM10010496_72970 [Streptomyces asoensis]|nr:hypothetical protein GCM10010496_72970 [Streptomyces asoensis]